MKRKIVLSMLASMLLMQSIPISAQEISGVHAQSTTAEVPTQFFNVSKPTDLSEIIVTLPANLDLALNDSKDKYINNSKVSAKGDLEEGYVLSVSTGSNIVYSSIGHADIAGAVTFGTQTWTSEQLRTSKTVLDSRDISVYINNSKDLEAGIYNSTVTFNIGVSEVHVHTPGEPVVINESAATCTEDGMRISEIYCTECGDLISTKTETLPASHTYTTKSLRSVTLPTWNEETKKVSDYIYYYRAYCDADYCCYYDDDYYDEESSSVDSLSFRVADLDDSELDYCEGYGGVSENELKNGSDIYYHLPPIIMYDNGSEFHSTVHKIDAIFNKGFENCKGMTGIELPPTIERIEDEAFKDCTNLETIKIPSSVYHIGMNIFSGCSSSIRIYYDGTKAQFQSIDGYDNLTGYTISCTDGYVSL